MKVYIYACEGMYQGLHGINDFCVCEVKNFDEANDIGRDLAEQVIEDYLWDDDELDYDPEPEWSIYPIKEDITLSCRELENICSETDEDDFIDKYCGPAF